MNTRAGWAHVQGVAREFQITEYPVILGLTRLLAWAKSVYEADEARNRVTKPGQDSRRVTKQGAQVQAERVRVSAYASRKSVTKPRQLDASNGTGARVRTSAPESPRLSAAQLDVIRGRARATRRSR